MQDFWTAIIYGVPAIAFGIGLAIWAERRFGSRKKNLKPL